MNKIILMLILFVSCTVRSIEQNIHGLVDLRYSFNQGIDSYLNGDYGKFSSDDGGDVLAHAALSYNLRWGQNISAQVTANTYNNVGKDSLGFTEAFLQYKGLPSINGYRLKGRVGSMFPKISMTNVLTGWTSPYTLNYSTINSWIAEEIRIQGIDFSIMRLGKLVSAEYDFEVTAAIFKNNDPAGSMIAWHGWTQTSRQSLRHENLPLPNSEVGFVPDESNIFLELDQHIGYHLNTQWTWHERGKLLIGYYDNRGDPKVVDNVQWAWKTRFYHLGIKWRLGDGLVFVAQLINGDTLMQSSRSGTDLVNNEYSSAFLLLSKKVGQHRYTGRIESFSVDDNDAITNDNNHEDGLGLTINYTYRLNRNWFLQTEFNWLDSERPSRVVKFQPVNLTERQLQIGVKYYF